MGDAAKAWLEANEHWLAPLGTLFAIGAPLVAFFWRRIVAVALWLCERRPRLHGKTGNSPDLPDMNVSDAIDYMVNGSTAKLKRPNPPRISEYGPTKGHLLIEKGVEHSDARTKLNERLISGGLKIWGYRQMPVTHMPTQFEMAMREIPQGYWDRMQLDFISCFHHTTTISQTMTIPGRQADLRWTGLMVNRAQMHRAWPRKPSWQRLIESITRKERVTYRSSG